MPPVARKPPELEAKRTTDRSELMVFGYTALSYIYIYIYLYVKKMPWTEVNIF